jgi:hypothetical protein
MAYSVAEHLISREHTKEHVDAVTAKLTPSLLFYLAAIAIGLAAPQVSIVIYLVIALFLLIPFRAIFRRRPDA